ncbi:hypothetical protein HCN44_010917 [Aphidius gifuensis]|uniref:HEAT repeat-containing protein 1 n=1 Tax=Aphidius gifuensis TaxID=684658 RepID=A0A835CWM4_APHGI|nr:hypothetical protein HCN44_010917 [Aphidius gifuensis]
MFILTGARPKRRSKLLEMTKRPELINTLQRKRGITILELIQRAKNIVNENLLVPVLFGLLRMCLSFEEQIDLISQCIRTSQNPQTHHHALLVVVELFKIPDIEIALYNIMPIFIFMGSSVLRQDYAYSIHIISKSIETIVPIINASNDEKHAYNKITQKLEFALTTSQEFTPQKIIDVCVELAKFFKSLPIEIDDDEVNIKTI